MDYKGEILINIERLYETVATLHSENTAVLNETYMVTCLYSKVGNIYSKIIIIIPMEHPNLRPSTCRRRLQA